MDILKPGRRNLVRSAGALGAAAVVVGYSRKAQAAANDSATQDLVGNGADPTGKVDSSQAFNNAYAKLPSLGGSIVCRAGVYLISQPLVFGSKPLAIVGDGSVATVFLFKNSGTFLTFTSPHLLEIYGISIGCPMSPGSAGGIYVSYQNADSQACIIDDVGSGSLANSVAGPQNFLVLENIWNSRISNVYSAFPPAVSGSFITLKATRNDYCVIDNTFFNCRSEGYANGLTCQGNGPNYAQAAPIQGLNIISPKFIGCSGNAISTYFPNAGSGGFVLNVLNLFLTGGTLNSQKEVLVGYQVTGGFISDTAFNLSVPNYPNAVTLSNSNDVQMTNCVISGASYATQTTALSISGGGSHCVSNLILANVNLGILLYQTSNVCGTGIAPQGGLAPILDQSGNNTNNVQWLEVGYFKTLR